MAVERRANGARGSFIDPAPVPSPSPAVTTHSGFYVGFEPYEWCRRGHQPASLGSDPVHDDVSTTLLRSTSGHRTTTDREPECMRAVMSPTMSGSTFQRYPR